MSDIFREVDEEVRRDRAAELWNKYQYLIIAAVIVVLIAAGAWRFYQWRNTNAAEAASARFESALDLDRAGKSADAAAAFAKIAADAPRGYRTLAGLANAAALSKTDPKAALAAYVSLAHDASLGPLFRETARLRAALLLLDAGKNAEAKTALDELAAPTGAYRHTARELLGAQAIATGDLASAGRDLDALVADPNAPQSARQAAELMLGLVQSGKPAAPAAKPASAEPAGSASAAGAPPKQTPK